MRLSFNLRTTNNEQRTTNDENGAALLLTFIVMITLISMVGAYLAFVRASTKSTGAQIIDSQAIYLADAGLDMAIWYLKNTAPDGSTDGSWRTTAYPAVPGSNPTDPQQESLGAGTFTMWLEDSGDDVKIYARGTVGGLNRTIEETVNVSSGEGGYPGGAPEAFEYAMHSFGSFTNFQNSEGTINNADVASAGDVKKQGDMTINNGNWIDSSGVSEPAPVDLEDYENIADNVESGGFTFEKETTYGSAGSEQIWYIQGNCTIEEDVTIYGSVIAENNITIGDDDVTIDAASGYPALISGNNITGNVMEDSTISGLIYAGNNATFNDLKEAVFNGTILSGNNTKMRNGEDFTINYDSDIITNPPPYFAGYEESSLAVTPQNDWNEI